MKKIFTLLAVLLASVSVMNAQTSVSWDLTTAGDLSGTSSESSITVSDVTLGSNINPTTNLKTYLGGNKATLFSPIVATNVTTPKTDGSQLVKFTFTVPSGFKFKPTNLSFYGAKDGSGNDHFALITIDGATVSETVIEKYVFVRGDAKSNSGETKSQIIESAKEYEGTVTLTFNLFGKPGSTSKGWALSNVKLNGDLIDSGDPRGNAPISWNPESTTLKVRGAFVAPVFNPGGELDAPVTFSSNNTELANVDENGFITLNNGILGTAIITATYNGTKNTQYKLTTATTTINVITNVEEAHKWVPYEKGEAITFDKAWTATEKSGTVAAGTALIDDENVLVKTVFVAKNANYGKTYFGETFSGSLQAGRVEAAPTADTPTGTQRADNSPLVVTPTNDITFVMYLRRQALEQEDMLTETDDVEKNVITRTHYWGMTPNDGKSVYAVDQNDVNTKIDQTLILGDYDNQTAVGSNDYLNVAIKWELKAGHTYTIWTRGTTPQVHKLGYYIAAPAVAPEAPVAHMYTSAGVEHLGFVASEGKQAHINDVAAYGITLEHSDANVDIYWAFVPSVEIPAEETVATQAAEPTIEKDGINYNLYDGSALKPEGQGTLKYFAHLNGLHSVVNDIALNDVGTGIEDIDADNANAPVEYYNLQGVRVAADALVPGIYVKRQGAKVEKINVR